MIAIEGFESFEQSLARGGFKDDLPGITFGGAFVEGGHGWRNGKPADLRESIGSGSDFLESGFFGFVSNVETCNIGIRREFLSGAFFQEVISEFGVIGFDGGLDDGMIRLEGLNDNFGAIEMTATDATDNLGEKLKSAFFGGKIRERKPTIGLNDADGGKVGEIEAAGEGLSANEDVDFAGFDVGIEVGEIFAFFIVTVKASDGGFRKKVF